jgi:hypothetical protein
MNARQKNTGILGFLGFLTRYSPDGFLRGNVVPHLYERLNGIGDGGRLSLSPKSH